MVIRPGLTAGVFRSAGSHKKPLAVEGDSENDGLTLELKGGKPQPFNQAIDCAVAERSFMPPAPSPPVILWPQVSAIAACLGVIVALVFHIWNLRRTYLSNSAKMVLDLVNDFNSEEMRGHRRDIAKKLSTPDERKEVDLRNDIPALEFLEELGYMTRRGILDKGMVWNSFHWFVEFYYLALKQPTDLIGNVRRERSSPTLYRELEWLYYKLINIDSKEKRRPQEKYTTPPGHTDVSNAQIIDFLKDEASLPQKTSQPSPPPKLESGRR
jgi:hypothetical protein